MKLLFNDLFLTSVYHLTSIFPTEEIFSAPRTNLTNGMNFICDGWDKNIALQPVVDCGGRDVEIVCDCCSTCCNDEILSRYCDESEVYFDYRTLVRQSETFKFLFETYYLYPKASLLKKLLKQIDIV